MMPQLGAGELIIILLIVIVLFGRGRVGRLGGELGTALREFRRGLNPDGETTKPAPEQTKSGEAVNATGDNSSE